MGWIIFNSTQREKYWLNINKGYLTNPVFPQTFLILWAKSCSLITFTLVTHTKKRNTNPIRAEKQPNSWPSLTITHVCLQSHVSSGHLFHIDVVIQWKDVEKWKQREIFKLGDKSPGSPLQQVTLWYSAHVCLRARLRGCLCACTLCKSPSRLLLSAIWAQLVSRHLGRERKEREGQRKLDGERNTEGVIAGTKVIQGETDWTYIEKQYGRVS